MLKLITLKGKCTHLAGSHAISLSAPGAVPRPNHQHLQQQANITTQISNNVFKTV
jgi:hypothetical protein